MRKLSIDALIFQVKRVGLAAVVPAGFGRLPNFVNRSSTIDQRYQLAVTLFATITSRGHVGVPFLPNALYFQIVIAGFFAFFVVFFTEHKHHHIRVLFNRTRFRRSDSCKGLSSRFST